MGTHAPPILLFRRSAIRVLPFLLIFMLLEATCVPVNANNSSNVTNSTTKSTTTTTPLPKKGVSLTNSSSVTSIPNKNVPKKTPRVASLSLNITGIKGTKKDKRQTHRGYTDIPVDERSFDDVANSSPVPALAFEGSPAPYAEKPGGDLAFTTPGYLPNILDRKAESSFFAPKLQPPSNFPKLSDIPPAATTILERRDEYFDSNGDATSVPGEAGRDYPNFQSIPPTSFACKDHPWPGYYADTEARCQVFWICEKQQTASGATIERAHSFLCPIGTLFNQQVFVCDWWFNVDCNVAPEFYSRNQYLYAGPGIGIDGRPTGLRGLPAAFGNGFGSQVQSSNQVPQVAAAGSTNVIAKSYPPQVSYKNNKNGQQKSYTGSQTSVNQVQQQLPNDKYVSHQTILTNRMHKSPSPSPSGPTPVPRPPPSSGNNLFTGGFKQPDAKEAERRDYSSSGQNQVIAGYQSNQGTPRHANNNGIVVHTTTATVTSSPRVNFNVDNREKNNNNNNNSNNKAVVTFSGTISSTARPISISTDIPSYNQGSSTLHTPKDRSQTNSHGSYQQMTNIGNSASSTTAPITTTFRSSSTKYTSTLGFDLLNQPQPPKPSGSPTSVGNRQIGSIGTVKPNNRLSHQSYPSSTPQSPTTTQINSAFIPSPTVTPPPVTPKYSSPIPKSNQPYVDRFGFVQNKQNQVKETFVTSTTQSPIGFSSTERIKFLGQRSNQFSNYNGQREIMYSPSTINANVEYPYSPSQQKNKQKLLEIESLKNLKAQAKELFSYPHYHGQRSNPYSDPDGTTNAPSNEIIENYFGQRHHHQQEPVQPYPQPHPHHQFSQPIPQQKVNPTPHAQVHGSPSPTTAHHNYQKHVSPTPNYVQISSVAPAPNPISVTPTPSSYRHPGSSPSPTPQQHFAFTPSQPAEFRPVSPSQQPLVIAPTPLQNHFIHPEQRHQFPVSAVPQHSHPQQFQPQYQQQQPSPHPQIIQHQQLAASPAPSFRPPHEHYQITEQEFGARPPIQASSSPSDPPFHQQLIHVPSQNLQLPINQEYFIPTFNGNFISSTSAPAFSKQILAQESPQKVIIQQYLAPPTSAPNGLAKASASSKKQLVHQHHSATSVSGLSTTMKPPSVESTVPPFANEAFSFAPSASPHPSQSTYIASPTQNPVSSTSPGHRQNPFVPQNHGNKRNKQISAQIKQQPRKSHQNTGQFPNSEIATTINYPEGTASLRLGVPGATSTKRLVEFSYTAHPSKGTIKSSTKTTPFPTVVERFNNNNNFIASSTTRRPVSHPSTTPHYRQQSAPKKGGARLAGAVTNRSTSSTTAIYVDTSAVAESVSTPVSISPVPTKAPAVATSNYGLKTSMMAKKQMARAWQNYFPRGGTTEKPKAA